MNAVLPAAVIPLLDRLIEIGVRFVIRDGRLMFQPASGVCAGDRALITEHRRSLVALVSEMSGDAEMKVSASDVRWHVCGQSTPSADRGGTRNVDAAFVYEERLAIAAELGMDVSVGSEADLIARREARREGANVPAGMSNTPFVTAVDAALEAFEPMGGLTLVSINRRATGGAP